MPTSSTHLLSLTIGNGIPTHVVEVCVVDMIIYPLVIVVVCDEIKKASSDIQNRL